MAIEILMPKMSFVVEEATILEWLKQPGEAVTKGEPLLSVESEKATIDIESPGSGILGPELAPTGTTVPLTTVIGYILAPGEVSPRLALLSGGIAPEAATAEAPKTIEVPEEHKQEETPRGPVRASPAAKRLAREKGIDLGSAGIEGNGPNGRITEQDVSAYLEAKAEQQRSVRTTPVARKLASDLAVDLNTVQGSGAGGRITAEDVKSISTENAPVITAGLAAEIVPRTGVQRITAERMAFSFQTAPHFYLNVQVNMGQAVGLRDALLPAVEAKAGVRLSFSDILVGAVAQTLRDYPDMNVSFENDQLKRFADVNVGLAMDTARGLTVPVFHRADQLSLATIASRRAELVARANDNRLTPDDLSGGTFTISNLGMFGIDSFSAIVNPPQAAILAVGRISKQAVVVEDTLQIQPTMWLTLSVDHRAIDGASAARFLQHLVRYLEEPYKLLV
ncbi:MAG: Dihydrolipoyllysine-residue acetyltransferase component of pyruvate dehydrogenase complex [Anaerolineae bacterium]|nr:Dihydrolipoyllysine-residue acetyltransferase component of pyruvate dehydrogenase complex [Anaerolineae bacterium]